MNFRTGRSVYVVFTDKEDTIAPEDTKCVGTLLAGPAGKLCHSSCEVLGPAQVEERRLSQNNHASTYRCISL